MCPSSAVQVRSLFYMERLDQTNKQSVLFTPKSNKKISWLKAANLKLSKIKSFRHRYSSFSILPFKCTSMIIAVQTKLCLVKFQNCKNPHATSVFFWPQYAPLRTVHWEPCGLHQKACNDRKCAQNGVETILK